MIAETLPFYGSTTELADTLQQLTASQKRYKNVSDNGTFEPPVNLEKSMPPLGRIEFNISVLDHTINGEETILNLSIAATKKGLLPKFIVQKSFIRLEQFLNNDTINNSSDNAARKTIASSKILKQVQEDGDLTEERIDQLFYNLQESNDTKDLNCIFQMNDMIQNAAQQIKSDILGHWQESFIHGLFHYYVTQNPDADQVDLIQRIKSDGKVDEATELRLLMLINRKFEGASEELQDAILEEVHQSVMNSTESNFIDDNRVEGSVDAEDIILLRRTIFGAGSDGGIGITKREAELLFRVDIDTANAENHAD